MRERGREQEGERAGDFGRCKGGGSGSGGGGRTESERVGGGAEDSDNEGEKLKKKEKVEERGGEQGKKPNKANVRVKQVR